MPQQDPLPPSYRKVGRYVLCDAIGSGGMATVHFGRLLGPAGFSRTVALKHLHRFVSVDTDSAQMFRDEARLASRLRHPNLLSILDVVEAEGELFLVLEYVHGVSVAHLLRRSAGQWIPVPIIVGIVGQALQGLHAAHEATDEAGHPLALIHRDVSPQNIMVGTEGLVRVIDFGIAKAMGRLRTTRDGELKGKFRYMAPEQYQGATIDNRVDLYASAVVLWEMLTGRALFSGDSPGTLMHDVLTRVIPSPAEFREDLPTQLCDVCLRALARDPRDRFSTAREMALALETALRPAGLREIGDWVKSEAHQPLERQAKTLARIERQYASDRFQSQSDPPSEPVLQEPRPAMTSAQDPEDTCTVTEAAPLLHAKGDIAFGSDLPTAESEPLQANDEAQRMSRSATSPGARMSPLRLVAAALVSLAVVIAAALRLLPSHPPPPSPSTTPAVAASSGSALPQPSAAPSSAESVPNSAPSAATLSSNPPAPGGTRRFTPRNCDPPYTTDQKGIRRLKPECLQR